MSFCRKICSAAVSPPAACSTARRRKTVNWKRRGECSYASNVNVKTSPIDTRLDPRSKALRKLVMRGIAGGRRGHVGSALSLVEILRVLYDDVLRYNAKQPQWPGRDRCLLSKGHGCLALYAILADKGFFPASELDRFCKKDGILGGHPEAHKVPGVEASTGSLGHGLAIGVGMALNA